MQTKLNSAFLLFLFFLNTLLSANDDEKNLKIMKELMLSQIKKEYPNIQCNQDTLFSAYEGEYVAKDFWLELDKTKNRALSEGGKGYTYTVDIGNDGFVNVGENWHEGQSYDCGFEKENALWSCNFEQCIKLKIDDQRQLFISAYMYTRENLVSLPEEIPMEGPLIRIGKFGDDSVYFEKIFQHKCYTSDIGEKWCFGKEKITINNKAHQVRLLLDIVVSTPKYGNVIIFDDQSSDNLFVFVPYNNGWKIFEDTWFDRENYVDVNPLTDNPWRILQ